MSLLHKLCKHKVNKVVCLKWNWHLQVLKMSCPKMEAWSLTGTLFGVSGLLLLFASMECKKNALMIFHCMNSSVLVGLF